MKIVALVKQTPDTAELPKVSVDEVQRGDVRATMVINPWDEFAAEEAIDLADRFDADTIAITLGTAGAADVLKHALAMGIANAMLVEYDDVENLDAWMVADLLVAAASQAGDPDIVLAGKMSVDGNSGSVFAGVACKLGAPLLTNVTKIVDVAGGTVTVERIDGSAQETVQSPLPVVISVAKEINDPRYPSFMGIRKANRVDIPTLSPSDLGVDVSAPTTTWTNVRKPEERGTEVNLIEGGSAQELAEKLADALIAEKII